MLAARCLSKQAHGLGEISGRSKAASEIAVRGSGAESLIVCTLYAPWGEGPLSTIGTRDRSSRPRTSRG